MANVSAGEEYERRPDEQVTSGTIKEYFAKRHHVRIADLDDSLAQRETFGLFMLGFVTGHPPLADAEQQPGMVPLPPDMLETMYGRLWNIRHQNGGQFRVLRQTLLREADDYAPEVPFLQVAQLAHDALEKEGQPAAMMAEDVRAVGAFALRALHEAESDKVTRMIPVPDEALAPTREIGRQTA